MFDLTNILQSIVYTFDNTAFSQHDFVENAHQFILHVSFDFGNELHSAMKELLENRLLYQIAFIAVQLAEELLAKCKQQVCIVVGNAALSELKCNDFPHVIDNQV